MRRRTRSMRPRDIVLGRFWITICWTRLQQVPKYDTTRSYVPSSESEGIWNIVIRKCSILSDETLRYESFGIRVGLWVVKDGPMSRRSAGFKMIALNQHHTHQTLPTTVEPAKQWKGILGTIQGTQLQKMNDMLPFGMK